MEAARDSVSCIDTEDVSLLTTAQCCGSLLLGGRERQWRVPEIREGVVAEGESGKSVVVRQKCMGRKNP